MSHAFKEVSGAAILEAEVDHTAPVALLQKLDHATSQGFFGAIDCAFVFDQLGEGAADDFLEGSVEEFRETTIGGTDLAVETESQKDVVERVDEVAKAL